MKYLPWIFAVALAVVGGFAVRDCRDANRKQQHAEQELADVLADSLRVDSAMAARQLSSDSTYRAAERLFGRANDSLKTIRTTAKTLAALLDTIQTDTVNAPSGPDTPKSTFWKAHSERAMRSAVELRGVIGSYNRAFGVMIESYDSMKIVADLRGEDRDSWKARAKALEKVSANLLAANRDARCILKWPVRVCPSPTATFVAGAATGATIALIAH